MKAVSRRFLREMVGVCEESIDDIHDHFDEWPVPLTARNVVETVSSSLDYDVGTYLAPILLKGKYLRLYRQISRAFSTYSSCEDLDYGGKAGAFWVLMKLQDNEEKGSK